MAYRIAKHMMTEQGRTEEEKVGDALEVLESAFLSGGLALSCYAPISFTLAVRSFDIAMELYDARGEGKGAAVMGGVKRMFVEEKEEKARRALDEAREMVARSTKEKKKTK